MQYVSHFFARLTLLTCLITFTCLQTFQVTSVQAQTYSLQHIFEQAAQEFNVPQAFLETIAYMEGRMSNNHGATSVEGGYAPMNIVKNTRLNILDPAARALGLPPERIQHDLTSNIRAGAWYLQQCAQQQGNPAPEVLADWNAALACYSHSPDHTIAQLYADHVYKILGGGFSAPTEEQETVTVAPQLVQANKHPFHLTNEGTALPQGCVDDGQTDYPGAINCMLNGQVHACEGKKANESCNYESALRPQSTLPINYLVIHDVEGTALDALKIFFDPQSNVSAHYIVDSDGTVYQVVREKDIAYQAGNYWYNQRSIGIEHAGYAATGFLWYNATQYLASARLASYLLQKYHIPLNHDYLLAHETIPAPTLAQMPNHEDPGPYWLWEYYMSLIHANNVPYPTHEEKENTITLFPDTGKRPLGAGNEKETAANFNYYYLYPTASTQTEPIAHYGGGTSISNTGYNIGTAMTYYYTDRKHDEQNGKAQYLYKIWYGVDEPGVIPLHMQHAREVWLAVPEGVGEEAYATGVVVKLKGSEGEKIEIWGNPKKSGVGGDLVIGDAPNGAIFASPYKVVEGETGAIWYAINYNHRQAWVPETHVVVL